MDVPAASARSVPESQKSIVPHINDLDTIQKNLWALPAHRHDMLVSFLKQFTIGAGTGAVGLQGGGLAEEKQACRDHHVSKKIHFR